MGGPVRPSGFIGWASTGATNVTEPIDAKKAVGWAVNEAPPSSYENWLKQKTDQWIQYLDWRGALSTLVEENFLPVGLYGFTGMTNGGATVLGPWQLYTPSQVNLVGNNWDVQLSSAAGSNGRNFGLLGSGYGHILANVGGIAGRGFLMEHVLNFWARPNTTGYSIEAGMMYNHSGVSGCNPQLGWVTTGRSGMLCAVWVPSGGSPTLMSFASGYAGNAGAWSSSHKLTIEARGPTMAFYSNDRLLGAAPAVMVGSIAGVSQQFGVRVGGQSGVLGLYVESMKLKISREPV